jgi:hypothetical protein
MQPKKNNHGSRLRGNDKYLSDLHGLKTENFATESLEQHSRNQNGYIVSNFIGVDPQTKTGTIQRKILCLDRCYMQCRRCLAGH